MTYNGSNYSPCDVTTVSSNGITNLSSCTVTPETDWPLERIVI